MTDHEAPGASTELRWPLDSTSVDGTLVMPAGSGPFPGVVMVAGSGPTDRDWNSPLLPGSNGSARLIAQALAGNDIASLRYDKRASGPHAYENMALLIGKVSMQSHLDELASAVRILADRDDIRKNRMFALANSEGTLHALHYQLQSPAIPLAGLVLIAPPGRSVGAVSRAQIAEQAAGIPNGEALLALYDAAIARFLAGEPIDPNPSLPEGVQNLLQALATPANLPFARELWMADAASLLMQVDIPVLVIIGKKDIQIDWHADGERLQHAAEGHANVTFLFPENANHILKFEANPRSELTAAGVMGQYNSDDADLDPQAMAAMLEWLSAHI